MASEAILRIKVITDASQAALGLDKSAASTSKFGSAMQKAALPAAAVGVALVAFGKHALDAASDAQQAQGAVESVFGKQAAAVEDMSKRSADAMGLSSTAYQNYAALVGAALQNAGFSTSQAVTESNKVMQRSADLAATFGGSTADAVEAINAAVARGEFDPLEKYAISLNQTAINAELAKRGQDDLTGSALKHAKAQAALDLVMKQSAKSSGQFARESDTAAGAAARASANFENASAALGQALLPAAAATANALASVAMWAGKNVPLVTAMAAAIGTLVAAILIYNAAMKIAAIVQTAFNVAMSANVIFLVIVGIIALIAVIIIVVKNWDKIRAAALKAWGSVMKIVGRVIDFIKKNWKLMLAGILGPFGIAVALIIRNWDKIRSVVGRVTDAIKNGWRSVRDVSSAVWSAIKDKVSSVASGIKSTWESAVGRIKDMIQSVRTVLGNIVPPGLMALMTAPFKATVSVINAVIHAIQSLINWVGSLIGKIAGIHWPSVPKGLSSILGKVGLSAAAPAEAARARAFHTWQPSNAPSARGLGTAPMVASVSGNGPQIVINGALDPEAVARQITHILANHGRRVGRVTHT